MSTDACPRCALMNARWREAAPWVAVPPCGECTLKAREEALSADGWVLARIGDRQAFLDCGVPTETSGQGRWWVPCWAAQLRELLFDTWWLGPALRWLAVDPEAQESTFVVVTLARQAGDDDVRLRVVTHLMGLGVVADGDTPVFAPPTVFNGRL